MDDSVQLVLGSGATARVVTDCAEKLRRFREEDEGYAYLTYHPVTPSDSLVPEDLAVTLAFNSRASGLAFRSLMERAESVDLRSLPGSSLEQTSPEDRDAIAKLIGEMATWPGFKASLATKVLHKKRPALIPVLDNRAIFEAYLEPRWPDRKTVGNSIGSGRRIRAALESIAVDVCRTENLNAWSALHAVEPKHSRIEILDMVWWIHFRTLEPLR